MLLRERGDHALTLFFHILCESRVSLLDEAGREAELEQRDSKRRREVIEVGADFGELYRLYGFVEELLHGLLKLVVEQLGSIGHLGNRVNIQFYPVARAQTSAWRGVFTSVRNSLSRARFHADRPRGRSGFDESASKEYAIHNGVVVLAI